MESGNIQRKLTAILSADVEGYSRLMGASEEDTLTALNKCRLVMEGHIVRHDGRIVHTAGDAVLAEFPSAVEAVRCALETQQELFSWNADLPKDRRMRFRMGINLGDVIIQGDDIYGDGVNVAARLESLAEAGGICISGTVYDQVESKMNLAFEYLGEHQVKNISSPIRVYQVGIEPVFIKTDEDSKKGKEPKGRFNKFRILLVILLAVAVLEAVWNYNLRYSPTRGMTAQGNTIIPSSMKPSIAVLPFVNMSDDPKQEYFSDGMTEDIITALSKVSDLVVTPRNSTFTFKGKPVKIKEVGKELGVRYILEGSVRKDRGRVRITAQLIDTRSGENLWADRYDRQVTDIFALQDEITQNIVVALQVELTEGDQAQVRSRATKDVGAWVFQAQGMKHFKRDTRKDNIRAKQMFERSLELDPDYVSAYVGLGQTHLQDAKFEWSESRKQSFAQADKLARKALLLDASYPDAHTLMSGIHIFQGDHSLAISEAQKAVALNPNGADTTAILGSYLSYSGRPEEGLAKVIKAMQLSPVYPVGYLAYLGHGYYLTGKYDNAIEAYQKYLKQTPENTLPYIALAAIYSDLGREEEARTQVEKVMELDHQFSLEAWAKTQPYKYSSDRDRVVETLRKAGFQ